LLEDGVQYRGTPGNAALSEVRFEQAYVLVDNGERIIRPPKVRGWPTEKLLGSERNEARAELQWRLSLIVLVPVMILAAIPLSKTNPRQGRFLRLAPAMLGYMVYIGLLLVLRSRMSDTPEGELPPWVSMAWVHLGAILVVVALYNEHRLRRWLRVRREATS
jgi:lipopolysaccharide export system permease protein